MIDIVLYIHLHITQSFKIVSTAYTSADTILFSSMVFLTLKATYSALNRT